LYIISLISLIAQRQLTNCIILMQILCQRGYGEEGFRVEQEYRSFDRRHFLEYGIQNGDPGRQGYTYYINYINYINYFNYTYYTNYTHYLQVRQDLGLADHVWQDKRTLIAQSVDNLGDQFRPAMRAGWLSYIRRAYPDDSGEDAGPVVGEDMLIVPD
jgi:hypothetical protein